MTVATLPRNGLTLAVVIAAAEISPAWRVPGRIALAPGTSQRTCSPRYQSPSRQAVRQLHLRSQQLFRLSLIVQSPNNYGNTHSPASSGRGSSLAITSRRTGDYRSLASGRDNRSPDRTRSPGCGRFASDNHRTDISTPPLCLKPARPVLQLRPDVSPGRIVRIDLGLSRRIRFKETRAVEIRAEFPAH
jgi:hypothetical protein